MIGIQIPPKKKKKLVARHPDGKMETISIAGNMPIIRFRGIPRLLRPVSFDTDAMKNKGEMVGLQEVHSDGEQPKSSRNEIRQCVSV
jgi:hypothetical protein